MWMILKYLDLTKVVTCEFFVAFLERLELSHSCTKSSKRRDFAFPSTSLLNHYVNRKLRKISLIEFIIIKMIN